MRKQRMTRVKLTIEYKGKDFCGWQSQKNGVSVQDVVESALGKYFDLPFVRVHAAGRTDVGVNAKGQTAHFDTEKSVNPYKLCLGVNVNLPDTVAVTNAEIVDESFHARFSAISKTYCYRVYVSPFRKPLLDDTHLQVYKPLNIQKIKDAAALFVGTHDFSAFQKTGSNLKGTVRRVNSFDVVEKPCNVLEFWVNGNAFLYNQVRLMCGLLLEVGKEKFSLADVENMLGGKKLNYKTLSAHGLTLEKVFY